MSGTLCPSPLKDKLSAFREFLTGLLLFLQRADVSHGSRDLCIGKLACVGGHLVPAFVDDRDQVSVGLFNDRGILEGRSLQALSGRGLAQAVGAVAHGTLRFVGIRTSILRIRRSDDGYSKTEDCKAVQIYF